MSAPLTPIYEWTRRIGGRGPVPVMNTRHGKHGGSAWSVPFSEPTLRQPQDGSVERRRRLATISSNLHTNLLDEPEDARLTGGTRSLTRRLMGLNIIATYQKADEEAIESVPRAGVA